MTNRPVSSDGEAGVHAEQSVSKTLLERVRADDQGAWTRLADFCAPLVYTWCRRFGVPAEDAADLLQDVLLTVHCKLGTFRRDRPGDTFRGWLWTVTRNKIHDFFRAG